MTQTRMGSFVEAWAREQGASIYRMLAAAAPEPEEGE